MMITNNYEFAEYPAEANSANKKKGGGLKNALTGESAASSKLALARAGSSFRGIRRNAMGNANGPVQAHCV